MRQLPRPATVLLCGALLAPAAIARPPAPLPVGAIQGQAATAPLQGRDVAIAGVVTADFRTGLGGVYLQDSGDGDPATSDAVFVRIAPDSALSRTPGLAVGARCSVLGRVVDLPAGRDRLTAIEATALGPCAPARTPAVRVLTALPADWGPLEGMHVRIDAPLTITGTQAVGRFGELTASFAGRQWQPSELARPGSEAHARLTAGNARQRLVLDDGSQQRDPAAPAYLAGGSTPRTGSLVTGVEGIVDRRNGSWRLQVLGTLPLQATPQPVAPTVPGTLKVAAFNLENLFNGDGRGGGFPTERGAKTPQQFDAQLAKLVATVHALDPDIAALMELENDGYGADASLARLVDALNADGAQWRFVDAGRGPGPDTIRVGLVYRSDRVATRGAPATLEGGPFGERSRVPLAQAFRRKGGQQDLVVVANHFKSKGCSEAEGADADQKDGQGCWNALRTDSSRRLHAWLQSAPLGRGRERVVILGDFNAYAMEDPVRWLREDGGWRDALAVAPSGERPYSYVYDGLSGRLDHALLSPALVPALRGAVEWHVNADEPDDAGYAARNVPGPWRSSDHDPLLLGFDL